MPTPDESLPDAVTPRYGLPQVSTVDCAPSQDNPGRPQGPFDSPQGARGRRSKGIVAAFGGLIVLVLILVGVIVAQALGAFDRQKPAPTTPAITPPSITFTESPEPEPTRTRYRRHRRTPPPSPTPSPRPNGNQTGPNQVPDPQRGKDAGQQAPQPPATKRPRPDGDEDAHRGSSDPNKQRDHDPEGKQPNQNGGRAGSTDR